MRVSEVLLEASQSDHFEPDSTAGRPSSSHEVGVVKMKGVKGGPRWYSKSAKDDLLTVNEYLSWRLYRAFGVRVAPNAVLMVDDSNRLRFVSQQVRGDQVPASADVVKAVRGTNFKDGLFVDAWLGNWDVIGNAPRFNLFVDSSKKVARIDTGGLDFRAMGSRKRPGQFGRQASEMGTFAGLGGGQARMSSKTAKVFAGMTQQDIGRAAKIWKRASWSKLSGVIRGTAKEVQEVCKAHGLTDLGRRADKYVREMGSTLKSRHAHVDQVVSSLT
tara:strand:- start:9038 stop:9856 length:819 start_codon:yes stop_codon:yes gene_type:complete